ncbi:MAG TPA: ABC transporter permease [Streptosporangiaceae bacterium]|nr:ABC transporter permease [Streptosporangiaceae bacterium]
MADSAVTQLLHWMAAAPGQAARAVAMAVRVTAGCARKEVLTSLTEKSVLIQSISLPVNYLIMMSLYVLAGSHAPTAVVMYDHGPYAQQFVQAMRQSASYRLIVESAHHAAAQMKAGTLVSVVTIPAHFDRAILRHHHIAVTQQVNNLNADLTDDAVRALRTSVTSFYNHALPGRLHVLTRIHNAYPHPMGYIPFLSMSVIVIALMVSGLLQAGNAAAREFEQGTISEILLSPARQWLVLMGRMLGAFAISLPAGLVVMAVVIWGVGDHPVHPWLMAGTSLLTLAVFIAGGTALGLAVRDRSTLAILTRAIPVPLFFLSGVFGVVGYQTRVVQDIATVLPTHYAIVLEQYAIGGYGTSTLSLTMDAGILAAFFAGFMLLAVALLVRARRPQVAARRAARAARPRRQRRLLRGGVRSIAGKDLRLWLLNPLGIIASLLVPVSYTLVVFLGAQAATNEPVAVVNQDQGPVGAALTRSIIDAGVLQVHVTSMARARQLYDSLHVAAVITIPADESQLDRAHQAAPISVQEANYNADLSGDIDRAVPDGTYAYYQQLGKAGPLRVTIRQHNLRPQDVQLYQYSILPVIELIITVTGILAAGMSVANEYAQRTINEMLLAPVSRVRIILGKAMAAFLSTFSLATLVLVVGAALGWARPDPQFWPEAIAAIALSSAFASGLGIAIGTWYQRRQPVSVAATIVAVELFALAGGLGCIFFEPVWLQRVAVWDPLTYGIRSLQQAVFYASSFGFWPDSAVLGAAALAALVIGTAAMRRKLIAQ